MHLVIACDNDCVFAPLRFIEFRSSFLASRARAKKCLDNEELLKKFCYASLSLCSQGGNKGLIDLS